MRELESEAGRAKPRKGGVARKRVHAQNLSLSALIGATFQPMKDLFVLSAAPHRYLPPKPPRKKVSLFDGLIRSQKPC